MVYYCEMKREILGFPRPVPREIPRDGRPEGFPEGLAAENPVIPNSFHNGNILVSSIGLPWIWLWATRGFGCRLLADLAAGYSHMELPVQGV